MQPVPLGKSRGGPVTLDLLRLVDARALVQANSGGGKSYLLRLLAEQAAGKVQTVILDPEGEFATLRERLDLIMAGPSGEIPADVRAAGLLARKLAELQASAVIDLYDLKLPERRRFVRLFLEALLAVPRGLWHPMLVLIDEAHLLCPERSAGEAESTDAVIALMSQGRKRGFAGVLSTQRLSKLHKDAAAEANNVFIGRTWLDLDQQRAGDLLGMGKSERQQLRDVPPGDWFAFGPALSAHGVVQFRADSVQTTHPKAGQRHKLDAPKASEAVKHIAAQLADLPQQAEAEVRDLAEAKRRITALERELRTKPVQKDEQALKHAAQQARQHAEREWATQKRDLERERYQLRHRLQKIAVLATLPGSAESTTSAGNVPLAESMKSIPNPKSPQPQEARAYAERMPLNGNSSEPMLGKCERAILRVLAQHPEGCGAGKLTLLAGYRYSGGFKNALTTLRMAGLIAGPNTGTLRITNAGLATGPYEPLPAGRELIDYWLGHPSFGKCEREILRVLTESYPGGLTSAQLCDATDYQYSGGFKNALTTLRTAGVLEGRNTEEMRASAVLFGA